MNAIIITAIWGVIMMLAGVFVKNKNTVNWLALAGIIIALTANCVELNSGKPFSFFNVDIKGMLHTHSFNLTFITVLLACTCLYFLLNAKDIMQVGNHSAEYFALIFFILCGVGLVCTFNTLLMLFLGIEIISIPLYILTGADKRNLKSNEASLKYFLLGAFSTGIMLMGIAFIYGGSLLATFYIDNLNLGGVELNVYTSVGLVLLLIAMSFKVSAAPFHFWTPDVYDGAPAVFTSFMASIVKAASFFAFVRLFENAFGTVQEKWQLLISIIIAATLLIGNITAVFQQSVKRMMAYSSIAQAGFMLFAVFALNEKAKEGLVLYAAAYSLATIGIFAVLLRMTDYTVDGFKGLAKRQPLLAIVTTLFLLSLTGIPLTAGFQAKFYMLMAAIQNGQAMWLVILAVLCAAISAYYYFRIIQAMYFKDAESTSTGQWNINTGYKVLLVIIAVVIIVLGIAPELLLDWLRH